jgi:hypothetical protein
MPNGLDICETSSSWQLFAAPFLLLRPPADFSFFERFPVFADLSVFDFLMIFEDFTFLDFVLEHSVVDIISLVEEGAIFGMPTGNLMRLVGLVAGRGTDAHENPAVLTKARIVQQLFLYFILLLLNLVGDYRWMVSVVRDYFVEVELKVVRYGTVFITTSS